MNGPNPKRNSATAPAPTDFLRTQDLSLFYGDKPAFAGVSLSLARGSITALVGPSGCGKTSFLNCLNRLSDLIPNCRVTGRVFVENGNILDPEVDVVALRRRVGMIFQRPNPFPLSIRRNLELPLRQHGIRPRSRLAELMERALRDVGLWEEVRDRLDGPAQALSGGQQQRLCIARALALEPEALLLDEPCSSLDPLSSGVVEELILSLRDRYTLLAVTHNLAQARRIADSVAVFWPLDGCGHLIEHGATRQIFEAPRHELTASYISGATAD